MDTASIALTLRLALATTACLLALATPLAWWIATSRHAARRIVQATVALPLVLPPTVLGFYLLIGLGPRTAPGRALMHLFGHPLAFTFTGLFIASILFSLPFAVQPLVAGFQHVDLALIEIARVLGATSLQTFLRIVLPLSRPAFLTAAVLTFTHTVGEFGVVLMIGGDIPGITRTLSIALYDQVQEGNYTAANHAALLLIALSLAALTAIYWRGSPRDEADLH